MKGYYKHTLIYLLLLSCIVLHAQTSRSDSLKLRLKNAAHDTTKMLLLFDLIEVTEEDSIWPGYNQQALQLAEKLVQNSDPVISRCGKKGLATANNNFGVLNDRHGNMPKALDYFIKSLNIIRSLDDKKGVGLALNNIGAIYQTQGNITEALSYYDQSLNIYTELGDKKNEAFELNNIAGIYKHQGNIPKAFEYFFKSLKIYTESKDKKGMARLLNNIGLAYKNQQDNIKALDYFTKSLKLREEIGHKEGIAQTLNNIGLIYFQQGKYIMALKNYERSIQIRKETGNKEGEAYAINNAGNVYDKTGDHTKALDCFLQALKLRKEINDKSGIAISLSSIGNFYYKQAVKQTDVAAKRKKLLLASSFSDSSLSISKELGFPDLICENEANLSRTDSILGNYKSAFEHYKKYIIYKDSINNETTRKATLRSQLNYEFETKEAVIKEQREKEKAVAEEKARFQQIVIWSVILGLLLVIIFAVFILRSLKTTRHQKEIIEEKQKEILDSIHYAKRIQRSLLPTEKYLEKIFKDRFKN